MQVVDVIGVAVTVPYHQAWSISSGPAARAANVLVHIADDEGHVGTGEASPIPVYSEETQQSVLHVVNEFLRPVLLGRDPRDMEALEEVTERAIHGNPFAKAAVDLALHDLVARGLGIPVYQLLGGRYRPEVPLVAALGIGSLEDRVREALHYVNKGFREIKLKIGRDPQSDLEQVAAIRTAVGPGVRLRVDANQGYRSSYALSVLRKLEKFDLAYIEQPLPRWDLDGMARLAQALDTPIMADESAFSPQDVITLIRRGAADVINIKVLKSGLRRGKAIAAMAEAAGIPCMVGSMIELGIGTAAGIHFACSTRNVTYACETIGPWFTQWDIVEGEPYSTVPERCAWALPEGPGWGGTLKPEYRYRP